MEEKDVKDFWSKHNLSSRIGFFLFLISYLITLLYSLFGENINEKIVEVVLQSTSLFAFLSLSMIILGPNTFVEAIKYWKCSNKNNDDNIKDEEYGIKKIYD